MHSWWVKTAGVLGPSVRVLRCEVLSHFLKPVCAHLCSKGGKAQIIGPEEEDEEDNGYAFNEVRRAVIELLDVIFLLFRRCILLFPPSLQLFIIFFLFLRLSLRWTARFRTSSCWSHGRHTWRCSWDTSSPSSWTPTLWSVCIMCNVTTNVMKDSVSYIYFPLGLMIVIVVV